MGNGEVGGSGEVKITVQGAHPGPILPTSQALRDAVKDLTEATLNDRVHRPANLEAAQDWLIALLDNTINATKENMPGIDDDDSDAEKIAATRAELRDIFSKFSVIIPAFVRAYKKGLIEKGLDSGKISVYQVGGRVVGKPLKASSDIDLVFAFEKPQSTDLTRSTRFEMVSKIFPNICSDQNIPIHNGYTCFQMVMGGYKTPEEVEKGLAADQKAIFLYQD